MGCVSYTLQAVLLKLQWAGTITSKVFVVYQL